MADFFLELSSRGIYKSTTLAPHFGIPIFNPQALEDTQFVFSDQEYTAKLLSHDGNIEDIEDFNIYLNDSKLNAHLDKKSGIITFNDFAFGEKIFSECYGLVQFSLTFTLKEEHYSLDSEYFQIIW